jgi:hypothetical protein
MSVRTIILWRKNWVDENSTVFKKFKDIALHINDECAAELIIVE